MCAVTLTASKLETKKYEKAGGGGTNHLKKVGDKDAILLLRPSSWALKIMVYLIIIKCTITSERYKGDRNIFSLPYTVLLREASKVHIY